MPFTLDLFSFTGDHLVLVTVKPMDTDSKIISHAMQLLSYLHMDGPLSLT